MANEQTLWWISVEGDGLHEDGGREYFETLNEAEEALDERVACSESDSPAWALGVSYTLRSGSGMGRLPSGTPDPLAGVIRERDEARAEVERLRRVITRTMDVVADIVAGYEGGQTDGK